MLSSGFVGETLMADSDLVNMNNHQSMPIVDPEMTLSDLCKLLVECEKAQHRYQWTSGFILFTLMNKPDTPKKIADFVDFGSMCGFGHVFLKHAAICHFDRARAYPL